ncbi:ROK family transcriptional regulator [Actinomadura sp. KC345]|uniref:ROK family transcriptional regulator n=1 Tax=Actinomadura sp. KC345 TaxID=2530371 RepID=UPI0010515EDB|nr:ROK family transcriptional regulator [Actinomadura sp. KC345]TDC58742.1 ROK family transcriptional regulator [Actinomadura sp. KC345]
MDEAPGSLTSLRSRNRLLVLDTVRQHGRISRVGIARATGLSRTTVSGLAADLLGEGILIEAAEVALPSAARGGRPATPLTLNPEGGALLGVHLRHTDIRVLLADLSGGMLGERYHQVDVDHQPDEALDFIADTALDLVTTAGRDTGRVFGMGVAVSAPVRSRSHALSLPSMLSGWTDADVAARLSKRIGLPVHVGNDANLGALAEWTYGAGRGVDDLIYIMLADGVGAGLIMDGRLYQGATGMAGELGHIAVVDRGYVCRCGNRGCLETAVGAQALTAAFAHTRGPGTTITDLIALLAADDPGARRVITDAGRMIGRALAGICAMLEPRRVIVGGEVAAVGRPLLDGIRDELIHGLPAALTQGITISGSHLGDRAEVFGAIVLATRRTSAHLLAPHFDRLPRASEDLPPA